MIFMVHAQLFSNLSNPTNPTQEIILYGEGESVQELCRILTNETYYEPRPEAKRDWKITAVFDHWGGECNPRGPGCLPPIIREK